jgi:hypothetical protein
MISYMPLTFSFTVRNTLMSSICFHFAGGTPGLIILSNALRSKDLILPLQHVRAGGTQMAVVVSLLDFVGHNMMPLSDLFRRKEAVSVSRVSKLTCVMLTSFIVRVDECIPVFISRFS